MIVLAFRVAPNFNQGAQTAATPSYRAELLRGIIRLVNDVHLIEYFLRLFQADTVLLLGLPVLLRIEVKAHKAASRKRDRV